MKASSSRELSGGEYMEEQNQREKEKKKEAEEKKKQPGAIEIDLADESAILTKKSVTDPSARK